MKEDIDKSWQDGPRWLPMVCFHGIPYYVDRRCREFRDIASATPIPFDSPEGIAMLTAFQIAECPVCGLELGIANTYPDDTIACRRCGEELPVPSQK